MKTNILALAALSLLLLPLAGANEIPVDPYDSTRPPERIGKPVAEIQVYPNPSRERTEILLPERLLRVRIYDADGRVVRDLDSQGRRLVLDRRDNSGRRLPAGVYLLQARSGDLAAAQRLVIVD